MAKPICLISFYDGSDRMRLVDVYDALQKKLSDYHVLVIPKGNAEGEEVEIKCFYEKDFTKVKYTELKKIILNGIENMKKSNA